MLLTVGHPWFVGAGTPRDPARRAPTGRRHRSAGGWDPPAV